MSSLHFSLMIWHNGSGASLLLQLSLLRRVVITSHAILVSGSKLGAGRRLNGGPLGEVLLFAGRFA